MSVDRQWWLLCECSQSLEHGSRNIIYIFLQIMRLLFTSIFLLVVVSNELLASGVDDKNYVSNLFGDNLNKIKEYIEVNERRSSTDDSYIQDGIKALRDDISFLIDQTSTCSNREDIRTIKKELKEVKEKNGELSMEQKKHISDIFYGNPPSVNIILSKIKSLNNLVSELNDKIIVNEQEVKRLREAIEQLQTGLTTTKPEVTNPPPFDPSIKHKNCVLLHGVQTIYPYNGSENKSVEVFCDKSDGGGWIIIQNRDSSVTRQNFYRPWNDYVKEFGNINGEFWLGLANIHALTKSTPMELRVDLEDYDGVKKWAKYDLFRIEDESLKYVLTLGNYSGDAGDSFSYHNGMKFTTYDQDNDNYTGNCAIDFRGAWWYSPSCHQSNLNGYQYVGIHNSIADGINWSSFRGLNYSLKKASMKIRNTFK